MPFDLIGFTEDTPGTGLVNIAPVTDQLMQSAGDWIKLKKESKAIIGVFVANCSTLEHTRLRQPAKNDLFSIDQQIIKGQLITEEDPTHGFTDLRQRPIPTRPVEKLEVLVQNATDEQTLVGVMIGNMRITQSMIEAVGQTDFILRGYADQNLVRNVWNTTAITWDQTLPAAIYAITGLKVGIFRATQQYTGLARIIIPSNLDWRPGVPCSLMNADHEEFQCVDYLPWSQWPLMGKAAVFDEDHMPNLEILPCAASTDINVEIMLRKLRDG
ncbi:hypothetical protein KAR91_58615 [Candidatus Pacearchaeota archaeon]|nr:hypothetical protein [Candidatus Pacearchaeota archaeon]